MRIITLNVNGLRSAHAKGFTPRAPLVIDYDYAC
jgi:exonuclease III